MSRFRPDISVIDDLYAVAETNKYGKLTFVLREAVLNLSMNFSASCTISVIDVARSHRLDRFSVATDRDIAYTAFSQNIRVKVYQNMRRGGSRRNVLLFDGYVYSVDRHINSDPSSFAVGIDVTLVTAATVYSSDCAELVGAFAADINSAFGSGVRLINMAMLRRQLTKYSLDNMLTAGSNPDIVKFLCNVIECLLVVGTADPKNKASSTAWMYDNAPDYTDLRKFIVTTGSRAVRLNPKLRPIAGGLGKCFVSKLSGALTDSNPVNAILQLCRHFGIAFAPIFIEDALKWVGIADLPMRKDAEMGLDSDDVVSYNYNAEDIRWGHYQNIAVRMNAFSCRPDANNIAAVQPASGYIIMAAGRDNNGRLVLKEFDVVGENDRNKVNAIGPIRIVQTPDWVIFASLQERGDSDALDRMNRMYCRALARTVYGSGSMFNGQLTVSAVPDILPDIKNEVGSVFKLDISSKAVDPGILYGRLTSVQYRVGSLKDLRATLHLSFDCVRTAEENSVIGVNPTDMLYQVS